MTGNETEMANVKAHGTASTLATDIDMVDDLIVEEAAKLSTNVSGKINFISA